MAGPRGKIYFNPSKLKCGIVTCGGLCPGLNDAVRAIGLSLHDHCGMKTVFGYRYGYEGLSPSYTIRSMPADAWDSAFCLMQGRNAVHAAMAGRTSMVVGFWKSEYTLLPISLAVCQSKVIDPEGRLWSSVLSATGQPKDMVSLSVASCA